MSAACPVTAELGSKLSPAWVGAGAGAGAGAGCLARPGRRSRSVRETSDRLCSGRPSGTGPAGVAPPPPATRRAVAEGSVASRRAACQHGSPPQSRPTGAAGGRPGLQIYSCSPVPPPQHLISDRRPRPRRRRRPRRHPHPPSPPPPRLSQEGIEND